MSSGWVDESATGSVNFSGRSPSHASSSGAVRDLDSSCHRIVFLAAESRVRRVLHRLAPGPSPLPPSRFSRPAPFKTGALRPGATPRARLWVDGSIPPVSTTPGGGTRRATAWVLSRKDSLPPIAGDDLDDRQGPGRHTKRSIDRDVKWPRQRPLFPTQEKR
jgi:hypothetical protein